MNHELGRRWEVYPTIKFLNFLKSCQISQCDVMHWLLLEIRRTEITFTNHNRTKEADKTVSAREIEIDSKISFLRITTLVSTLPNIYFSLFMIYFFMLMH